MSELSIHFGQCGNEIGSMFIDSMYNLSDSREKWFLRSNNCDYARSLLIDTETKVVDTLLATPRRWKFKKENVITMSGGSSNNWALGYFMNGPMLEENVMEALRTESEICDNIRSITCFLSSGGGTGSGVGSFIVEKLRDIFSKKCIIGNLVLPFSTSESPVRLYNTVLSLSKLYDSCDAIVTFYNDFLFKQCTTLYKDSEFKVTELNNIIVKQLNSLFRCYSKTSFISHHMNDLIPVNNYKLISLKSCPFIKNNSSSFETPFLWKCLVERLRAMLTRNNDNFWEYQRLERVFSESKQNLSSYYRSIGNMVICNGKGAATAKHHATKCFQNDLLYTKNISNSNKFVYIYDDKPVLNQLQFCSLVTNSGVFNDRLNEIVENSWFSYTKHAYCHHFEKYGLQRRDFTHGFFNIETIVKMYNAL